jgi:hypothetical protein
MHAHLFCNKTNYNNEISQRERHIENKIYFLNNRYTTN